ncbi:MAG: Rieske 2Fe-2S domain-containing protein, partial [Candidatus Limnocylindrus sp.]
SPTPDASATASPSDADGDDDDDGDDDGAKTPKPSESATSGGGGSSPAAGNVIDGGKGLEPGQALNFSAGGTAAVLLNDGGTYRAFERACTHQGTNVDWESGNGYTYLQKTFLPRLLAAGVDQKTIDQITVKNPARVLTLVKPSA